MVAVQIISAAGGGIIFLGAIIGLLRGIFKQTAATEDNTKALDRLQKSVDKLFATQNGHEGRLTSLEDWRKFGGQRGTQAK